jgi:hypothetical protein
MNAAKKDNTKGVAKPDSAPKTDADQRRLLSRRVRISAAQAS